MSSRSLSDRTTVKDPKSARLGAASSTASRVSSTVFACWIYNKQNNYLYCSWHNYMFCWLISMTWNVTGIQYMWLEYTIVAKQGMDGPDIFNFSVIFCLCRYIHQLISNFECAMDPGTVLSNAMEISWVYFFQPSSATFHINTTTITIVFYISKFIVNILIWSMCFI